MRPLRIGDDHRETLALALVVWLCSTPLVLLLAVPFLGWKTATTVVLAWLIAVLVLCFAVCLWRLPAWRRAPLRAGAGLPQAGSPARFRTFRMLRDGVSRLRRQATSATLAGKRGAGGTGDGTRRTHNRH